MRSRRRLGRSGLAALVAIAWVACADGERNRGATNIVLISIDCLNQRQLEHGIEHGYTPVTAALARDGLVFTRAYTQAPWTTPSHTSMLTGLYPSQHGHTTPYREMLESADAETLEPAYATLPQLLAEQGYETAAFVGQGPISARFGLSRGFQRFEESAKDREDTDLPGTLDAFRGWIDEGGDAPFFLFLHTFDFHTPRPRDRQSDRDALGYIDAQLGVVIDELKRRGLYDGALVILTGDHGSNVIRTRGKCCIHGAGHYEENLKVPLLVKLPRSAATGRRAALARHVDILATVADVVGFALPDYRGPGVSLVDVASGRAEVSYSFSEADARCVLRYGVVSSRYKYIFTPQGPRQQALRDDPRFSDRYCVGACRILPRREELYDLAADPFEERDLLRGPLAPEHARALETMRAAFREHLELEPQFTQRDAGAPAPALRDELRDSLRKLGYLE